MGDLPEVEHTNALKKALANRHEEGSQGAPQAGVLVGTGTRAVRPVLVGLKSPRGP